MIPVSEIFPDLVVLFFASLALGIPGTLLFLAYVKGDDDCRNFVFKVNQNPHDEPEEKRIEVIRFYKNFYRADRWVSLFMGLVFLIPGIFSLFSFGYYLGLIFR